VDLIFKRHVPLRPVVGTGTLKAAQDRVLGDPKDWDEAGAGIRREGDGSWRIELPLEAVPFLQATNQWTLLGPVPAHARTPKLPR